MAARSGRRAGCRVPAREFGRPGRAGASQPDRFRRLGPRRGHVAPRLSGPQGVARRARTPRRSRRRSRRHVACHPRGRGGDPQGAAVRAVDPAKRLQPAQPGRSVLPRGRRRGPESRPARRACAVGMGGWTLLHVRRTGSTLGRPQRVPGRYPRHDRVAAGLPLRVEPPERRRAPGRCGGLAGSRSAASRRRPHPPPSGVHPGPGHVRPGRPRARPGALPSPSFGDRPV